MKKKISHQVWITGFLIVLCGGAFPAWAGSLEGTVHARGVKSSADVVVYIDKIPGKEFAPPAEPVLSNQLGKEFIPHVLPILKGTTVDFLNSDAMAHNVFSPDAVADRMNLGSWNQGEKRSFTFKKPGEAVILCNLHPEMEGWIVVLETPYFAVTDAAGKFSIENVPAGTYTVKTWHEKLKAQSQEVTVPGSGAANLDLQLSR